MHVRTYWFSLASIASIAHRAFQDWASLGIESGGRAKSINRRQPVLTLMIFRISIVQACGQKVTKRHWSDTGVCLLDTTRRGKRGVKKKKKKKKVAVLGSVLHAGVRSACRIAHKDAFLTPVHAVQPNNIFPK
jgi:hypothetical protein